MEKSLKDKIGEMNQLGSKCDIYLRSEFYDDDATEDDVDEIYAVADGLTEKFVMDTLEGNCSLQRMLSWSCERLENLVDSKIKFLKDFLQNRNFVLTC